MAFELVSTVIHGFTKEANSLLVTDIVKKNVLLNNDLPAVQSLVTSLSKLLGKPGNAVTYGQFGDDQRQGPFPSSFKGFASDSSNEQFLSLSHLAVDELVNEASKQSFATGGHILASHYKSDGAPYFLVAMIKQRGGVTLDGDYVPVEITEIDLSKIHQAARINLNSYNEAHCAEDSEQSLGDDAKDHTYLCFLGNSKSSQASGYFITALGCTKGIASSRATRNAIDGIAKYFKKPELRKYKTRARDAVIGYLQRQLATDQNATVEDICNAAVSCLLAEERVYADDIWEVLNNENSKVPSQFVVNENTLKSKTTIKSESDSWSIQFEHQILGADSSSVFYYNREKKSLTINELGTKLIETIETELDSRYTED